VTTTANTIPKPFDDMDKDKRRLLALAGPGEWQLRFDADSGRHFRRYSPLDDADHTMVNNLIGLGLLRLGNHLYADTHAVVLTAAGQRVLQEVPA
jgi:hypothetical protein